MTGLCIGNESPATPSQLRAGTSGSGESYDSLEGSQDMHFSNMSFCQNLKSVYKQRTGKDTFEDSW